MSPPGSLATALASLPGWLQPTADAGTFDALLLDWARACGWRTAGVVWPCEGAPVLSRAVQNGTLVASAPPPDTSDVSRRLRRGEPAAAATTAQGALRLYARLQPNGRAMGGLYAERPAGAPLTDADKSLVELTARLMEQSPALGAASRPGASTRTGCCQRLQDAAVIAGRMAHDFDNILTGIIGFSDLTVPLLPAGSQPAGFVAEIAKVGQRGIAFTQQLHQLSRSGQTRPQPGAVAAAVAKEEARLRPACRRPGVRVEKPTCRPACRRWRWTAGPLRTVVGHLLENAVEAGGAGGAGGRSPPAPVELSRRRRPRYLGGVGPGAARRSDRPRRRPRHQAGGPGAAVRRAVLHDQGPAPRARAGGRVPHPVRPPRGGPARTRPPPDPAPSPGSSSRSRRPAARPVAAAASPPATARRRLNTP